MQVAEIKTSSAAQSQIQAKREPFFLKEGQDSFFSKSTETTPSFFSPTTIQPKLTIGQPNDKYEVEADQMADKVVQRLADPSICLSPTGHDSLPTIIQPQIQKQENDTEVEEPVNAESDSDSSTSPVDFMGKDFFRPKKFGKDWASLTRPFFDRNVGALLDDRYIQGIGNLWDKTYLQGINLKLPPKLAEFAANIATPIFIDNVLKNDYPLPWEKMDLRHGTTPTMLFNLDIAEFDLSNFWKTIDSPLLPHIPKLDYKPRRNPYLKDKSSVLDGTIWRKEIKKGQANDKYEVEADAMADKVVQRLSMGHAERPPERNGHGSRSMAQSNGIAHNTIQTKCNDCEQEEQVQKKEEPLLNGISKIQRKPIFESNAEQPETDLQTKPLSNPVIQKKCSSCENEEQLQKKEDEEFSEREMGIQTKSMDIPGEVSPNLQGRLISSKGRGSMLSPDVQDSMSFAFGVDFSDVRVHTGSESVQMNHEIGAQAFTHGDDIYFNQGKYDTNSIYGKHLLAHELTHTIQQGGNKNNTPSPLSLKTVAPFIQKQNDTTYHQYARLAKTLHTELVKAIRKAKKDKYKPSNSTLSRNLDLNSFVLENGIDDKNHQKYISGEIRAISEEWWNNFLDHVDKKGGLRSLNSNEIGVYNNAIKSLDAAEIGGVYSEYFEAVKMAISSPYFFYYHIINRFFTPFRINIIPQLKNFVSISILTSETLNKTTELLKGFSGIHLVYLSIQYFFTQELAKKLGISIDEFTQKIPLTGKLPKRKSGLKKRKRTRRTKKQNESFSGFRKTKMKSQHRRLFKKLPKWMRKKGMADSEITATLDRMAAMGRDELKEFLEFLKTRGESEPKPQDVTDQTTDKEQDQEDTKTSKDSLTKEGDQPQGGSGSQKTPEQVVPKTSKVLSEEFEILKKLKDISKNSGDTMDSEAQAKILELLKSLSPEQLEAFFQFIKENADALDTEKASSEDVINQFKKLTPAQIEQNRLAKLFSETVDPKGFTEEDIKQASFSFNSTQETQKNIRYLAQNSNDKINEIKTKIAIALQNLDDHDEITREISELKPFDPKDFEISLEMLMVKGILLGAGKMSPELEPETQKLARQIDSIPQMIKELLWDIEKELVAHAITTAIPLVGWAKAVVTAIRVSRLVKRMNDLRKAAKRIKKAYNIYLKIRKAIETAQNVFEKSKDFVSKFESIKNTWKSLQKKMEDLEASDSTDEQLELIFDELMEMMEGKMDALEPFLEKLYIPEDAIDDPEKLIEILFNIPLGVREFGKLYQLYSSAGKKDSDLEFQEVIFWKSIGVGGLLYPFIGFMIDVIGETLIKVADSLKKKLKGNFSKLKKKKSQGKQKGKKGRFRSLWSRGYIYEKGGKNNPEFKNALNSAYANLKKKFPEEPEPSKWDLGLRLSLRLKLRKFIKAQNKSRPLAQGRPKKERGSGYRPVPIPKLKYKLRSKPREGYFDITLKINPEKKHRIKAFTMKRFSDGIEINNFGSTEARALRKWLQKRDYELIQLGRGFWHIRKKDHLQSKRGLPYLVVQGNTIKTGISGKNPSLVDKIINLNSSIKTSSQVPEGYYVKQGGRKVGRKVYHKYVYLVKKKSIGEMNPEGLFIDEKNKLQKGLKEKTHPSKFVIIRHGKYMLQPKFRRKSKQIRNIFYGKSYRKAVMDMKKKTLGIPFPNGLQDPMNKNKYYAFYPGKKEKIGPFKKNVKPGHIDYPTLDHEPPLVQHWNTKGRNVKHKSRLAYNNFHGLLNTNQFRRIIVPWKFNSSKGGGGVFNFKVGKKFRGPGEDKS